MRGRGADWVGGPARLGWPRGYSGTRWCGWLMLAPTLPAPPAPRTSISCFCLPAVLVPTWRVLVLFFSGHSNALACWGLFADGCVLVSTTWSSGISQRPVGGPTAGAGTGVGKCLAGKCLGQVPGNGLNAGKNRQLGNYSLQRASQGEWMLVRWCSKKGEQRTCRGIRNPEIQRKRGCTVKRGRA